MENAYYEQKLHELADMTEKSAEKQLSFFQSLLIASVTLLGILISLHDSTTDILLYRLLYAVAIVLLSLGILSVVTVVYDWSMMVERGRQEFAREAQNALQEDRKLKPVFLARKKGAAVCEKITYVSLSTALLLLTVYAVVSLFS